MSTRIAARPRTDTADRPKYWTTAEFDRLIGQGVLEEGSSTYLWEGQIVEPMPEHQPHWNAVTKLLIFLIAQFHEADWTLGQSGSLALEDGTKPQPDLLVAKGPRSRYRVKPASPSDVVLLVEVSSSTYPRDSGERLRKYAKRGIPLYWIVNIPSRRVEVYEGPEISEAGTPYYRNRTDYGLDAVVPLDLSHEGTRVITQVTVIDILCDSLEPSEGEAHA